MFRLQVTIINQADISVHGHDMFSPTVWDPLLFTFAV
jgi:hypothetical protein